MNRNANFHKHLVLRKIHDKSLINMDPIVENTNKEKDKYNEKNIIRNSNTLFKDTRINLKCIYLIQTSKEMPELLQCLKNKDHILLSYKENTPDTTIFFPKSTWTTGRNKIREYVIEKLEKKYDYYIFLDEDIKFTDFTQEDGFNYFENLLGIYQPYIANPNYKGYYPNVMNAKVRTTIEYDGMYNAFSRDAFFSNEIFPYTYIFDSKSWWMSQYVIFMLCSILNKQVVLFQEILISNENHSEYPKGLIEFITEVEEYVSNKLLNINHLTNNNLVLKNLDVDQYINSNTTLKQYTSFLFLSLLSLRSFRFSRYQPF